MVNLDAFRVSCCTIHSLKQKKNKKNVSFKVCSNYLDTFLSVRNKFKQTEKLTQNFSPLTQSDYFWDLSDNWVIYSKMLYTQLHTSEKKYFAMRLKPLNLSVSPMVASSTQVRLSTWMMMTSGWTNHPQWSSDTRVTLIHIPQAITPTPPKHCQTHNPSVEIKSNCQSVSHTNWFRCFSGKLINVLDKECECCCGAPKGFYVVII